jgi:nudix-type nucleoside diphosphatase (YffH/AdpP family)
MADFFFYGTLCHAPLLAEVVGREVALVPARLEGHASYWVEGHAFPMIAAETGGALEGVLAPGLSPEEAARLDYYEGGFAYSVREVLVGAGGNTGADAVPARVYFPDAARLMPGAPWQLAAWQAAMGEAAVLAARRFMSGFGRVPQDQAVARYPTLLAGATATVRAARTAPTELRRRAAPGDVEVLEQAEPYAKFFAIEEYDLRHRRFDGTMSEKMRRAVFLTGDAATVLPYDPLRDRVLVIEQFRAGPFARGDRQPWMLEPVAGRIDPGESPEQAVRREAVEEADVTLGALHKVAEYYPTPGTMAEYLYSYVGIADLAEASPGLGGLAEEHEDIRIHVLLFERLMALVASGEAQVAPLLVTAWWLAANRERLRAEARG